MGVVHLVQLMGQYQYIIVKSVVGAGHSVDFDKCVMSCIHHYSIIRKSFTALEIPCSSEILKQLKKAQSYPTFQSCTNTLGTG